MPLPEPALPGPIHVEPELATRMLCSDADLAARDDPRGSAAEFTRFLLIERLSGFGREAGDDALRAVYGQASSEITAVPGLRPFAIRPVGRTDGPDSQVRWIGRVGVDAVLQPTATRPTSQDLFALDTARASAISPLFAVCTNGSRDRCCAVKGRDLAARLHHALDDPDEAPSVVEISHLGGHRFAPTMLVLPWAYAYARLDAEAALDVAYAAQDGLVHPTGLRGRADLGPAAQAAEVFWRTALGPAPVDSVTIESVDTDAAVHTVTARVQGRSETLALRRTAGPTIGATTCGGKPIPTGRWAAA